jgi:pyruvate,water dikinase
VIEQGGVLSHGSIVARELGIPAVTSAVAATRLIRTGDRLHLDANSGLVTILSRAET